jgi:hypothetical protein
MFLIKSDRKDLRRPGPAHFQRPFQHSPGCRSSAKEIKDMKVQVNDTRTLSMGTGVSPGCCPQYRQRLSFEKVLEKAHNLQSKVKVFYIIETLEYLRRGGRSAKGQHAWRDDGYQAHNKQ